MFENAKLVDAGIDYLRVTCNDERNDGRFRQQFWELAEQDQALGYEVQNGGAFGFVGKKTRHALWGKKQDWSMLQVSGRFAKHMFKLAQEGTQATRIDIQETFHVGEGEVEKTIRTLYNQACAHKGEEGCPVKVKMIEERHRAQTVYIGSRASDYFVRIYDKFEESGKEEYRGCVRVELEVKGRASKALWKAMVEDGVLISQLLDHLKKIVSKRGIEIPAVGSGTAPEIVFKKDQSREENQLWWLRHAVMPTVTRLAGLRGWIQPFSMLFEGACNEFDRHAIMLALVNVFGH